MSAPPLPSFDAKAFPEAPWLGKFYALLRPFFEGTAREINALSGVFRSAPIAFTVPDDWVTATLTNSWTAARTPVAWRQSSDGRVYLEGTLSRASAPSADSAIITGLPAAVGQQTVVVGAYPGTGLADVVGTQLRYVSGATSFYALVQVSYAAVTRTPPNWAKPLEVACPFQPGVVVLTAAEVDSTGRNTGTASTHTPAWTSTPKGLSILRCPTLTPKATYRLTVWALSG